MARQLASIKKIKEIHPVQGADKIVRAVIDGFDVVIKKDDFEVGDLCVYCETDSILPKSNRKFAFLEGKPIKIKRIRGIYSYGIAFPLTVLPSIDKYDENDDVTDVLEVTKFDDEKDINILKKKKFPSWIPKTDETRFQTVIDTIKEFEGTPCLVTEKLDGSSTTHWLDKNGKYHVCSRNCEVTDKNDKLYKISIDRNIPELLKKLPKNSIVQGELVGPGIQRNVYKLNEHKIYMFNLRIDNKFVNAIDTIKFLKDAGFDVVPIVHEYYRLASDKDTLLNLSMGKSKLNSLQPREGIVIRSIELAKVENDTKGYFVDGRFSFKIINPKYELKYA